MLKIARYALLLFLVVFSAFCIGFIRDNITMDIVRQVSQIIDLSGSDRTPSETSVTISTDKSSDFVMIGSDLAVVSNSGISLYGFAGSKLYSYNYAYTNAAFTTSKNGKTILVYDTEGTNLAVYSSVSKLLEKTLDYEIKSACINDIGYFAVVNSEKTYRSGVIVFDGDGKEIFRWMSPDKYVTSVDLNSNGQKVVCSAIYNKNGAFVTEIAVYDTSSGEKTASFEAADTLALKVGYADNDSKIYMLSDGAFSSYSADLEPIGTRAYNQSNAKFFRLYKDCVMIAESDNLAGNSMTLRAYDYGTSLMFEQKTQSRIIDIDYTGNTLYLLKTDELEVLDVDAETNETTSLAALPLGVQYKAVMTDQYGRYVLISSKSADRSSLSSLLESSLEEDKGKN